MKKRLLAILLSALLLANLGACNAADRPVQDTESNTASGSDQSNDTTGTTDESDWAEGKTDAEIYQEALALLDAGDDEGAYARFLHVSGYADAADYLEDFVSLRTSSWHAYEDEGGYTRLYEYDEFGRMVSFHSLPDSGTGFSTSRSYQYDAAGNLTQWTRDPGKSCAETWIYEYDAAGNPIKQYDPRGNITLLEYDAQGNIIKVLGNGYLRERSYDAAGHMIEEVLKTDSGFYLETSIYEYNEQGDLIKMTDIENGGAEFVQMERRYEYDEHGNKIRYFNGDGDIVDTEWKYDENGTLTEIRRYLYTTNAYQKITYRYNANGQMIEQTYDREGAVRTYYYEYDCFGNNTKVSVLYDDSEECAVTSLYSYQIVYLPNAQSDGTDPIDRIPAEMIGKG